jgi:hypothetical protein
VAAVAERMFSRAAVMVAAVVAAERMFSRGKI